MPIQIDCELEVLSIVIDSSATNAFNANKER